MKGRSEEEKQQEEEERGEGTHTYTYLDETARHTDSYISGKRGGRRDSGDNARSNRTTACLDPRGPRLA